MKRHIDEDIATLKQQSTIQQHIQSYNQMSPLQGSDPEDRSEEYEGYNPNEYRSEIQLVNGPTDFFDEW